MAATPNPAYRSELPSVGAPSSFSDARPCPRCKGQGWDMNRWVVENGRCFRCGGSGLLSAQRDEALAARHAAELELPEERVREFDTALHAAQGSYPLTSLSRGREFKAHAELVAAVAAAPRGTSPAEFAAEMAALRSAIDTDQAAHKAANEEAGRRIKTTAWRELRRELPELAALLAD